MVSRSICLIQADARKSPLALSEFRKVGTGVCIRVKCMHDAELVSQTDHKMKQRTSLGAVVAKRMIFEP